MFFKRCLCFEFYHCKTVVYRSSLNYAPLSFSLSLSQLLSLRYILIALYLHSVKCGAGVFQRFCFALRTLLLFVVVFCKGFQFVFNFRIVFIFFIWRTQLPDCLCLTVFRLCVYTVQTHAYIHTKIHLQVLKYFHLCILMMLAPSMLS